MFDIGFSELLLFGVIALIVLGPEKLPSAARTAGQWYAKLRRTVSSLQSEIEAELDLAETRKLMQDELAKIRHSEAEMRREMEQMRGNMREFESAQNESLKTQANDKLEPEQAQSSADVDYAYGSVKDKPRLSDDWQADDTEFTFESDTESESDTKSVAPPPIVTKPWENMWFVLGAYDKARRLPAPPYVPNYQADMLLNASMASVNIDKPITTPKEANL